MQGVGQLLRALFQGFIETDVAGYLQDDGVFGAVLGQVRHKPELVVGVLGGDVVGVGGDYIWRDIWESQ